MLQIKQRPTIWNDEKREVLSKLASLKKEAFEFTYIVVNVIPLLPNFTKSAAVA